MTTIYELEKRKTLRRKSHTLYAWRNLELSGITHRGIFQWNLAWTGTNRLLPDGRESIMFGSLNQAAETLHKWGYKIEGDPIENRTSN